MPTNTANYNLIKPNVNDPADQDLWGGYMNENMDTIDTQLNANSMLLPVGTVLDYAGASAPTGFVFAYGQALDRVLEAALFAIIGTTYGSGDGSTTFNVPDLRGRNVAGKDDMGGVSADRLTGQTGGVDGDVLGDSGGTETHQLTEAELAAHVHDIVGTEGGGALEGLNTSAIISSSRTTAGGKPTQSTGGDTAHNNVQPTFILNKIIKT